MRKDHASREVQKQPGECKELEMEESSAFFKFWPDLSCHRVVHEGLPELFTAANMDALLSGDEDWLTA
jgi:hypothetical protein